MKDKLSDTECRIQKQFNQSCVDFNLLEDGDNILVGLSGGKDSLLLLRLLARRSKIWKPKINVSAAHVIMDNIPYVSDLEYLETFCAECGVAFHIIHSCFDESTDKRHSHCFLCSWNRRKALFNFAENNGMNKIALGHHQDDILTTMLMNLTFEGRFDTMPPMLQLEHYNLRIIRPLCQVKEKDIISFASEQNFTKQKSPCPYEDVTKRKVMNDVFHLLENVNPEARYSLWKAVMRGDNDSRAILL